MADFGKKASGASVDYLGIKNADIYWNLSPEELSKIAIEKHGAKLTSTGAITVDTGEFTGRSPKDRFIVKDDITKDAVWWGDINIPFDSDKFDALYNKVMAYLNDKEIYVRDSYVCADPEFRLNVRSVTEYSWSNLFAYNMFLRPEDSELEGFEADWHVVAAPGFMADPEVDGTRQSNFAILNFSRKIALIGGTGYTGEMKKRNFLCIELHFTSHEKHVKHALFC